MKREELQALGVQTILNNKKCVLALSPRSGKTFLTLTALKKLKGTTLVSVPSEFMIEKVWFAEMLKWKFTGPIDFTCHASLHKQPQYDNLVLDECHSCISEIRIEGIKQIKAERIIGLSGSLSKKSREILKERLGLEVKLEHSVDKAVENNIISDYEIYIHQVPMSLEEINKYNNLTSRVNYFKTNGVGKQSFFANLARARFLYATKTKINYAKKLIDNFDRCICFTQLITVANDICKYSFSSKSKENTLQLFQEEKINQLGLVKLANEGQTFINLDTAVVVGVNSSEVSMIQRILRTMNLDKESKLANIHIIVSKDTVESDKWLLNALQSFNKEKIKIIN